MNWRVTGQAGDLGTTEIDRAEGEGKDVKPSPALVTYARTAADTLAQKLGGKDVSVEIHGHDSKGRGFTPGHVTVTVSRLDPKR